MTSVGRAAILDLEPHRHRRGSQVVRQRSAKPLFVGSIPTRASRTKPFKSIDRLKAFFRFAHDAGWAPKNVTKAIKPAALSRVKVQPFSLDEQHRLLAKPQTAKIRAFVHTLYHAGLRISDCCFLNP